MSRFVKVDEIRRKDLVFSDTTKIVASVATVAAIGAVVVGIGMKIRRCIRERNDDFYDVEFKEGRCCRDRFIDIPFDSYEVDQPLVTEDGYEINAFDVIKILGEDGEYLDVCIEGDEETIFLLPKSHLMAISEDYADTIRMYF